MEIKYIDIHSHLNLPQFDADADTVAQAMVAEGVAAITIGTNAKTSARAIELAERHENLFACIGLHPVDPPRLASGEAGGAKTLKTTAQKIHFWYYHKFVRIPEQFKAYLGCYECMRCFKVCPVGINIQEVIKQILEN